MLLARLTDYEARYGEVADEDRTRVETLLGDASALVLSTVEGSTRRWVTDEDEAPPRQVVMVVVTAARRALRGDEGVVREQLGEFAVTYRADSPRDIWLTDQEVRAVRKAAGLGELTSVTLVSPYSGDRTDAAEHIYDNDLPL